VIEKRKEEIEVERKREKSDKKENKGHKVHEHQLLKMNLDSQFWIQQ
jgi:hypothetical protein